MMNVRDMGSNVHSMAMASGPTTGCRKPITASANPSSVSTRSAPWKPMMADEAQAVALATTSHFPQSAACLRSRSPEGQGAAPRVLRELMDAVIELANAHSQPAGHGRHTHDL